MNVTRSSVYWALVFLVTLWLGMLLAAPFARSQHSVLAPWIYASFAPICHQLPERSFYCFGSPLAVCARCTGIYLGFWLGLLSLPWAGKLNHRLLERPRLILWFMLPMGMDVITANTHLSRFLTGMTASFPLSLFVWLALEQLRIQRTVRRLS